MKNFRVWLEEKLAVRNLKHTLLNALGFAKDALDNGGDIPLRKVNQKRLLDQLSNIGLNKKAQEILQNYARNSWNGGTLNAMLATIKDSDFEQQDTLSSEPAVLPQANEPVPKPINKQQMIQQQQQQQQMPPQGY